MTSNSTPITKSQLCQIVKSMREKHSTNISYITGEDISSIEHVHCKVISVSGEKLNKIDKTVMVIVKYYNDNSELCSLSLPIKNVYKYVPEIIYMKRE